MENPEYINILIKIGEDITSAKRLVCSEACASRGSEGYKDADQTMYLEGVRKLDEVHSSDLSNSFSFYGQK